MSKVATMKLTGLKELEEGFKELSKGVQRGVLRRALLKAGEPMRAEAARLAPEETGRLKRGIEITASVKANADPGKVAFASAMASGGDRGSALSAMRDARRQFGGSDGYHASAKIWPTADSKRDAIKANVQEHGSIHQSPQPFMRPAYEAKKGEYQQTIAKEMRSEIEKAAARAARRAAKKAAGK